MEQRGIDPTSQQPRSKPMRQYKHPAIKQLKEQQIRFAPEERRLEQLNRAEKLLTELDPNKKYPYQYVCFRLTEYRPESYPHLMIDGTDLEHDLELFIQDLSSTVRPIPAEEVPEPVLTLDEVSRSLKVSTKTITRWRDKGLVTRRILCHGKRKVGIRRSLLQRFLERNGEHVEKSSKFTQLTEEEKIHFATRETIGAASPGPLHGDLPSGRKEVRAVPGDGALHDKEA